MEVKGFGRNSAIYHGLDKDGKKPSSYGKWICSLGFCTFIVVLLNCYVPYGPTILAVLGALMALLVIYIIITMSRMAPSQKKASKVVMGDYAKSCPGEELEVKPKGETISDVVVPREWVDASGKINPVKPVSLRRSVDITITAEMKRCKYAEDIRQDDPTKPIFHVHGWPEIADLSTVDEFWTAFPYYPSMPAAYAWQDRVTGGWCSPMVEVDPVQEDVLGHIYLLAVDKGFHAKGDSIYRIEGREQMNADVTDPAAKGKIISRFGYKASWTMGNFVPEHPDAFIFRGDVIRDSGLKVLHTYRIVIPAKSTASTSLGNSIHEPLLT